MKVLSRILKWLGFVLHTYHLKWECGDGKRDTVIIEMFILIFSAQIILVTSLWMYFSFSVAHPEQITVTKV